MEWQREKERERSLRRKKYGPNTLLVRRVYFTVHGSTVERGSKKERERKGKERNNWPLVNQRNECNSRVCVAVADTSRLEERRNRGKEGPGKTRRHKGKNKGSFRMNWKIIWPPERDGHSCGQRILLSQCAIERGEEQKRELKWGISNNRTSNRIIDEAKWKRTESKMRMRMRMLDPFLSFALGPKWHSGCKLWLRMERIAKLKTKVKALGEKDDRIKYRHLLCILQVPAVECPGDHSRWFRTSALTNGIEFFVRPERNTCQISWTFGCKGSHWSTREWRSVASYKVDGHKCGWIWKREKANSGFKCPVVICVCVCLFVSFSSRNNGKCTGKISPSATRRVKVRQWRKKKSIFIKLLGTGKNGGGES